MQCSSLLEKGIFHRAAKVERKKDRDKKKKKKDNEDGTPTAVSDLLQLRDVEKGCTNVVSK